LRAVSVFSVTAHTTVVSQLKAFLCFCVCTFQAPLDDFSEFKSSKNFLFTNP
jgi:hypothetical protein